MKRCSILLSVSPEFPYTLGLVLPALEVVGPRTSVIINNGADQIERWTQVTTFSERPGDLRHRIA